MSFAVCSVIYDVSSSYLARDICTFDRIIKRAELTKQYKAAFIYGIWRIWVEIPAKALIRTKDVQKDVIVRQKCDGVGVDLHLCQHVNFIDRVYRQNFTSDKRARLIKFFKIDIVILPIKPAWTKYKVRSVALLHICSLAKYWAIFIHADDDALGVF